MAPRPCRHGSSGAMRGAWRVETLPAMTHDPTPAGRHDIYAAIHKALRACMADALIALGRLDVDDPHELAATSASCESMLTLMRGHALHENHHIHPALESARPGASAAVAHEHVHHLETIDGLRDMLTLLRQVGGPQRPSIARRLYAQLASFVAENLRHMQQEETQHNALLWQHYDDAAILGMEAAIVASLTAEEGEASLLWMARTMASDELLSMLAGMRAQVPDAVFGQVLELVRSTQSPRRWAALQQRLAAA